MGPRAWYDKFYFIILQAGFIESMTILSSPVQVLNELLSYDFI